MSHHDIIPIGLILRLVKHEHLYIYRLYYMIAFRPFRLIPIFANVPHYITNKRKPLLFLGRYWVTYGEIGEVKTYQIIPNPLQL